MCCVTERFIETEEMGNFHRKASVKGGFESKNEISTKRAETYEIPIDRSEIKS